MASGDDGETDSILAGFLFGNIDEEGKLEDDFIDDEAKRNLSQLANFGIVQSLAQDIAKDSVKKNENCEIEDFNQKSIYSIDYSTIDELAEESIEQKQTNIFAAVRDVHHDNSHQDSSSSADGSSYNKKPSIIHLPSIVPKAETMSMGEYGVAHLFSPHSPPDQRTLLEVHDATEVTLNEQNNTNTVKEITEEQMEVEDVEDEPELSGLAALEGKTVTDLFPDFRPRKVLRFSRLFGPKKYVSAQWKGIKKKKRKKKQISVDNALKQTGFELRFAPPPKPEELEPNEALLHVQPIPLWAYGDQYKYFQVNHHVEEQTSIGGEINPEWLNGPASYWYVKHGDLLKNGAFHYGFKEKTEEQRKSDVLNKRKSLEQLPGDEYFNLVCLKKWEDDIIWSSEDYKPKDNSAALRSLAGWIPSGNIRTMQAYLEQLTCKEKSSAEALISANILKNFEKPMPMVNKDPNSHKISDWYSLFPIENHELIYSKWEDKVIWDAEAMEKIPTPEVFQLDPNDENLILNLPEDSKRTGQNEQTPKKEYKSKSRFMSKKEKNQDSEEDAIIGKPQKDRFNLSNDEYYMPKQDLAENQLQADLNSLNIQHSTPAVELQRPFFPTYFSPLELRALHRPALNKKKLSTKTKGYQVVHSLYKRIKKKSKEREKERQAFGGGEMFFMRQPEDLSGMDGDLIFMEYCEELPLLVCQAGMNTRIRNYYRRKHGKDANAPALAYGDISYVQHSPFLGQLSPGQTIQALENNLFRAPIYTHRVPTTDFLMFKIPNGYYARKVKDIFTVGQLCPKYEVHGPNSKRANNHIRDFLQVFIYRLFLKCPDTPRRIKMEDIRKAFPKHSESTVRKRLKLCADFRRTGADCNWWVLKSDFRLPSEEEMRAMVTPEQTCSYFMMLAAEQRLKDAGYGEKSLFAPDDDDNEDDAKKVDEEIQTAPWNTTRAYIQAMKGKCLLQVTGVADPTGCGEGFSYIRIPNKPITKDETEEQKQAKKQKLVTGTDADLRRLNLKQARLLLKEFGVSQEEIEKLSRWEVIDKVRTMSTAAAKQGTTEVAMNKFARGSRFTVAEHQEKYKDECQRIFDLQNRVLSSDAILSTEEESSDEEGSDMEDLGKDLESMLSNKKISNEEHEEEERKELKKLLSENKVAEKNISNSNRPSSATSSTRLGMLDKVRADDDSIVPGIEGGKRLLIHRKFKEGDGEFIRTETVKNPNVIDAYLRIVTRDKNYREVFASQDEKHKEDMRRERRRIQEQLRRIRRNEERERLRQLQQSIEQGETTEQPTAEDQAKLDALSDKPTKILKCGACGDYGHMKTNKMCPKYSEAASYTSLTDDDFNSQEMSNISQDNLIKVEGTKITLGKALLEAHEDMKRKSLTIRIPKENVIPVIPAPPPPKKKRRPPSSTQTNADYLVRHHKSKNRRRTNPVVALNVVLEYVSAKLKDVPESWPFHNPVSAKDVPDYYDIVKIPMDLQTIRENIKKGVYHTRDDFLEHVTLIHSNCLLYNGVTHPLTKVAEDLVNVANKEIRTKEKELGEIEREINPLLDEDPQVGFSWLCESILSNLKTMPESWPFHQPVPVKVVPDYYDVIKNPIDLETLKQFFGKEVSQPDISECRPGDALPLFEFYRVYNLQSITTHSATSLHFLSNKRCQGMMYQTREQFMTDINLLYSNSLTYNGAEHAFTKTAEKLTKKCADLVSEVVHAYTKKWTPTSEEILKARLEPENEYCKYAVVVERCVVVVGHLGKTGRFAETIFRFFLRASNGNCLAEVKINKLNDILPSSMYQNAEKFTQLEYDIFNLAEYEPLSVSTSDILEDDSGFSYETDPFNLNSLQPTEKQIVIAGNEDEFVDVEGDESMLQQLKQQQTKQQQQHFNELHFVDQESANYIEGIENYQPHIYTGDFEHQEGFEGFQSDIYADKNFSSEMESDVPYSSIHVDLLLQDLVHSDEDEEESEEEEYDDIPLDDGEDEDFEVDEDVQHNEEDGGINVLRQNDGNDKKEDSEHDGQS